MRSQGQCFERLVLSLEFPGQCGIFGPATRDRSCSPRHKYSRFPCHNISIRSVIPMTSHSEKTDIE